MMTTDRARLPVARMPWHNAGDAGDPGSLERPTPAPIPPRRTQDAVYDLAIVGSGAAAFAAAIKVHEEDARVVVVERGTVGGTCVNIGCVPSTTLLRASESYHAAGHHPFHGIATRAGAVDWARTVAQKDGLVDHRRQGKYTTLIGDYGWELVRGEARFRDLTTLTVGDRIIQAEHVIVATGATPAVPSGHDRLIVRSECN